MDDLLIDRERERAQLDAQVADARSGCGSLVLLAGEAGVGKTTLARRVLAACAEGDELKTQLAILRRLARSTPADTVSLSRTVAKKCIELEKYPV